MAAPAVKSFEECKLLFDQLEDSPLAPNTPEFQELVSDALQQFRSLFQWVEQQRLFSRNEEIADVPNAHLKFLLVPYYFAGLLNEKEQDIPPDSSPEPRLRRVTAAKGLLSGFLARLDDYKLLNAKDKESLLRDEPLPPDAFRTDKIERGRREMDAKKRLRSIEARRVAEIERKAAGEVGTASVDEGDEDERALWLTMIEMFGAKAITDLALIEEEFKMLEMMTRENAKRLEGGGGRRGKEAAEPSKPLKVMHIPSRSDLLERVFGNFNKPTMTIDEFYDRMVAEGRLPGSSDGAAAAAASAEKEEEDEDADLEGDAAAKKARAWDKFLWHNPKGSGNTMFNRG